MITHANVDDLERAVLRLHLDLEMLTQKVERLLPYVEPPEPPPDLLVTIKSLHESNDGLRVQLEDAKRTERDLDAEVVRLTKENQRLTRLAWQAEQDKRAAEDALKSTRLDLLSSEADAERARNQRDNLALRLADAQRQREAMAQRVVEQRRGLLSILGVVAAEDSESGFISGGPHEL
jgi:chromosome segregation ATPase